MVLFAERWASEEIRYVWYQGFLSSITQDLLSKALNFASEYIYISKCDNDVINHARKSLLFDGSNTWTKKQGGVFDVSMGA